MSKNSNKIILSSDDTLKYKRTREDNWKVVKVISKAGKSSGRFKNCYNVKDDYTSYYLNLDDIYRFEKIQINTEPVGIEEDIRQKWSTLGSPITFAGITKIYEYYNGKISVKDIERVLSTLSTYTKYKQKKEV